MLWSYEPSAASWYTNYIPRMELLEDNDGKIVISPSILFFSPFNPSFVLKIK